MRSSGRRAVRASFIAMLLAGLLSASTLTAAAQSPSPTLYSFDSASTQGWPPTAPYTSTAPSAVVVEGVQANAACPGFDNRYTPSNIESKTVYWVNSYKPTITEITPETYCGGSLSYYETTISQIENFVESHASANVGTYWGGIMLDEEPGYGLSVADLEALNSYVYGLMINTPGLSFYYTENQPNGWVTSQYNAIIGNSYPAPQAYTSSMVAAINSECSTYGKCLNQVTINSQYTTSWGNPSWVLPQVNGNPWSVSYSAWGSGAGWWNEWRAV